MSYLTCLLRRHDWAQWLPSMHEPVEARVCVRCWHAQERPLTVQDGPRLLVSDGPVPPTIPAKWHPDADERGTVTIQLDNADARVETSDDSVPTVLLLARMRQRVAIIDHALRQVTADRDLLHDANGRLLEREKSALREAESLREALAHVGRELEQDRALVAVLTRQMKGLTRAGAGTAMRVADDHLLIQPPGACDAR